MRTFNTPTTTWTTVDGWQSRHTSGGAKHRPRLPTAAPPWAAQQHSTSLACGVACLRSWKCCVPCVVTHPCSALPTCIAVCSVHDTGMLQTAMDMLAWEMQIRHCRVNARGFSGLEAPGACKSITMPTLVRIWGLGQPSAVSLHSKSQASASQSTEEVCGIREDTHVGLSLA